MTSEQQFEIWWNEQRKDFYKRATKRKAVAWSAWNTAYSAGYAEGHDEMKKCKHVSNSPYEVVWVVGKLKICGRCGKAREAGPARGRRKP